MARDQSERQVPEEGAFGIWHEAGNEFAILIHFAGVFERCQMRFKRYTGKRRLVKCTYIYIISVYYAESTLVSRDSVAAKLEREERLRQVPLRGFNGLRVLNTMPCQIFAKTRFYFERSTGIFL